MLIYEERKQEEAGVSLLLLFKGFCELSDVLNHKKCLFGK